MNQRSMTPSHVSFDTTPEIFASDQHGTFTFPLLHGAQPFVDTAAFDELRFVVSLWHPSEKQSIDLDRAYVELRACFDTEEEHWTRIAEIEPVVPPYNSGESFDGWIVLPVLAPSTAFRIYGGGFEPRARLQIRASLYLVG